MSTPAAATAKLTQRDVQSQFFLDSSTKPAGPYAVNIESTTVATDTSIPTDLELFFKQRAAMNKERYGISEMI